MALEVRPEDVKRFVRGVLASLRLLDNYRVRLLGIDFKEEAGLIERVLHSFYELTEREVVRFADVFDVSTESVRLLRKVVDGVKSYIDGLRAECERLRGERRRKCFLEWQALMTFFLELKAVIDNVIIFLGVVADSALMLERMAVRKR